MTQLYRLAKLIRSKNAGPFELTIDVLFDSLERYRSVADSGAINAEVVASIYGVAASDVRVFCYDAGRAIKVSFPRPVPSGDLDDFDVTGGQQYAPLVDLEIPGVDATS